MDKDGNLHYSYYYDYRTEHERYSEDENWTRPTHNISHLRGNMDGNSYGEYDNVNFARGVSGELYMSVYDDRIAKIVCANGTEPIELLGSEFTGYDKNKTVKFSLRGTKEGDAPFEFIWSDDTTEEKSVILEAGENSVDCSVNLKSTSYFGVVGVTAGIYDGQDDIESDYEAENEMPEDTDNDLMADCWEREYLEFYDYTDIKQFKPEDDIENVNGILQLGDDATNLDEYRGYLDEYGFRRFGPDEKDVLIEIVELAKPWLQYLSEDVGLNIIRSKVEGFDTYGNPNKCMITIDDSYDHKPQNWYNSNITEVQNDGNFLNDLEITGDSYYSTEQGSFGTTFNRDFGKGWGMIYIFKETLLNLYEKNRLEDLLVILNGEVIGNKFDKDIIIRYKTESGVWRFKPLNPYLLYKNGIAISTNLKLKYDGDEDDTTYYGRSYDEYLNVIFLHEAGHIFGLEHCGLKENSVMGSTLLRPAYDLNYLESEIRKIDLKN